MSKSPVESVLDRGIATEPTAMPAPSSNGNHRPEPPRSPRQIARSSISNLGPRRISAVYLWLLFFVIFSAINPDTFPTSATFRLVFSEGAVTCMLALAFLVPLAANTYDLSIGAVMSLSLSLCIWFNLHTGLPAAAGAAIAVFACMLAGAVSGFIVVRLRVNSFIATLGMSQVLLAAALFISSNRQLIATFPDGYANLGLNEVAGVPLVLVYLLALAIVLWFVLEHTPVGRYLFATGGNEQAARLSGVRTDRAIWGSLIASGAIAGLAGVVLSMRSGIFSSSIGPGYLFPAVAAVFLGASQFQQRPNVWGTLIAYFALAFGIQGLALSSSSGAVWSQPLFEGVALIIAVAFASRPVVAKLRERSVETTPPADGTQAATGSGQLETG